jgi:lipid A ethanolaminephosphotransferase
MAVKLFRETGRASLLDADEARWAVRRAYNPLLVALGLALWLTSVGNLALWRAIASTGAQAAQASTRLSAGELVGLVSMVFFGSLALLSLLSWRWLIQWAAAALLVLTALGLYALLFLSNTDSPLILNVLKSLFNEAKQWADPQLWLTVLLLGVLPAAVVWRLRLRRGHAITQVLRVAVVFVLALGGFLAAQALWGDALRNKLQQQPDIAAKLMPMNWRAQWPQAWLGPQKLQSQ